MEGQSRNVNPNPEKAKWFESFKAELVKNGIDINNRAHTMLIRGYDFEKAVAPDGKDIINDEGAPVSIEKNVIFGAPDGIKFDSEKMSISQYASGFKAISEFNADDIDKLYTYASNYAGNQGLYFCGTDAQFETHSRMVFVNSKGEAGVSSTLENFGLMPDNEFFPDYPGPDGQTDIFNSVSNHASNKNVLLEYGNQMGYENATQVIFDNSVMYEITRDFLENPEMYANTDASLIRQSRLSDNYKADLGLIEGEALYSLHRGIGSERGTMQLLRTAYGDGFNFNDLKDKLSSGLIRSTDGTKIKIHTSDEDNILAVADLLETGTVVLFDRTYDNNNKPVEKRIGHLSSGDNGMKFRPDTPTKTNHYQFYDDPNEIFEPADISDQLKAFVTNLKQCFDDAGLDMSKAEDRVCIKMTAIQFHNINDIRDAFRSYEFDKVGTAYKFPKDFFDAANDYTGIAKEASNCTFDFNTEMRKILDGTASQNTIQRMYILMNRSQNGGLFFSKPGDSLDDLRPIYTDQNGMTTIVPPLSKVQNNTLTPEEQKAFDTVKDAWQKTYPDINTRFENSSNVYLSNNLINNSRITEEQKVKYAQDLNNYKNSINVAMLDSVPDLPQNIHESLSGKAYDLNMSREEYINTVASYQRRTDADIKGLINDNSGEPINFRSFSGREQRARENLSQQALKTFAGTTYDTTNYSNQIFDSALANDDLTQQEVNDIIRDRDLRYMLFDFDNSPNGLERNTLIARMYVGNGVGIGDGLSPQDAEITKQRMQAEAINQVLTDLTERDYSKYENMTDEQLVQNYDSFSKDTRWITIARAQLTRFENNPYVDAGLIKKARDCEEQYSGMVWTNINKMGFIQSQYYKQIDVNQILSLSTEQSTALYGITGMHEAAIINSLSNAYSQSLVGAESKMRSVIANKDGVEPADINFYNAKGEPLNSESLKDAVINKETVFGAASYGTAFPVHAFTFNGNNVAQESDISKHRDSVTAVNSSRKNELIAKANEGIDPNSPEYMKTTVGNFIRKANGVNPVALITSALDRFSDSISFESVNVSNRTEKFPRDDVRQAFADFIKSEKPTISFERFAEITGIPDAKRPSKAEMQQRQALTNKLIDNIVQYNKNGESSRIDKKTYDKIMDNANDTVSYRQFSSLFFDRRPGQEANNKALTEKFLSSPQNAVSVIAANFKRLIDETNALYGKINTDEDVVENFDRIFALGNAAGMEYNTPMETIIARIQSKTYVDANGETKHYNFKEMLDKETGSPQAANALLAAMAEAHEKAYEMQDMLSNRIEFITNPYYSYGLSDKINMNNAMEVMSGTGTYKAILQQDPSLRKYGNAIFNYRKNQMEDTLSFARREAIGMRECEAIYNSSGESIELDDFSRVFEEIKKGETLLFFAKGDDNPKAVKFDMTDGKIYPSITRIDLNREPAPTASEEIREIHSAIVDNLENIKYDKIFTAIERDKSLSKAQKEIESNVAYAQLKLSVAIKQSKADDLSTDPHVNRAALELVTAQTIKEMVSGKNLDDKTLQKFTSAKSRNELTNMLGKNPAVKEVLNELKKDPSKIRTVKPEELSKRIMQVNRNQQQREHIGNTIANARQNTNNSKTANNPQQQRNGGIAAAH